MTANGGHGADVVIVGGGVIGCAVAYFLGADHHARCIVVERDGIATNASGTAAGELSPAGLFQPDPAFAGNDPFVDLSVEGLRLHKGLAPAILEESGIDYRLTDTPILRPAFDEAEAQEIQAQVPLQRAIGMTTSWLTQGEVAGLDSWLPPEVVGATLTDEVQVESELFARALAAAAQNNGTHIVAGEVTDVINDGDRATGVRTDAHTYAAQAVVIAAGPWSQLAGPWLGNTVPVSPLRGQIVHLKAPARPPHHAIFHSSGYVLPKPDGTIYAGTTDEDVGFAIETTDEARESILAAAHRLAPATAGLTVQRMTACLRPMSEDGLPLIGAVPGWRRLYLATGHGRKGILQCLATGKHLAQLIARGSSIFPLEAFAPSRFGQSPGG